MGHLGDGDTSSFKEVVDVNLYKKCDIIRSKLECINHVQKRLGTRLHDCVKSHNALTATSFFKKQF